MIDKKSMVVILTWNNYDDTCECIESLLKIRFPDFSILCVDNASTDDSIQKIKHQFPQIIVLELEGNMGISGGYNAGLKYAVEHNVDYIVLSNNDIVFTNNSLAPLIRTAQENKKVGIVVPKTFNYYAHNKLAGIGGRWRKFPPSVKIIGFNKPDSPRFKKITTIEYAISSCYLVTRKLIESIGYYDTNFFFYNDDWDFSIRTRKADFQIILQPNSQIYHKISISTQKSEKKEIWWNYLGRSTVRFYKKHRNNLDLDVYIIWFIIREVLKLNFNRIFPFLKGVSTELKKY